ncbi:hypothetical protein SMA60_27265, partial [Escherichia coli]
GLGRLNLFRDTGMLRLGKITGTASAAKNAAAGSEGAVAVWAGHCAVQRQFIYFFSECLF